MKTHKTVLNEKQEAYNALLEVTKIHGSMFMHFLTKVRKKKIPLHPWILNIAPTYLFLSSKVKMRVSRVSDRMLSVPCFTHTHPLTQSTSASLLTLSQSAGMCMHIIR